MYSIEGERRAIECGWWNFDSIMNGKDGSCPNPGHISTSAEMKNESLWYKVTYQSPKNVIKSVNEILVLSHAFDIYM